MKTTKCIIIDDEPIAIRIIERHFEVFSEIELVATFNSASAALDFLRTNRVDLILSDIQMPRMTGVEFIKALLNKPAVIFTTAYRNYAVEAYDLDVVDYILKPISLERLGRAIARYHERGSPAASSNNEPTHNKVINVRANKETVRLPVAEIAYIESYGDYIIIYHAKGKIVSRERISNMESQLPPTQFARIHRRYLVALNKIESIHGNMLLLDGSKLPVGRTYRSQLKEAIGC